MESKPGFQLLTSLRYDPLLLTIPANIAQDSSKPKPSSPFYIASFHRDRILKAAEHFKWATAADTIRGPEGLAFFLSKLNDAVDST